MNILQRAQSRLQWRLLFWLLPLVILPTLILALFIGQQWQDSLREQVNETERSDVARDVQSMQEFLETSESDLRFLAELDSVLGLGRALQNSAASLPVRRANVEQDLLAFSSARGIYDQIRFLDAEGNEIVRVDSDGETAFVVANAELQNKADRSYFVGTAEQPEGGIYVSPLNLNREGSPPAIEGSLAEDTLVPVIRYGTPLYLQNAQTGQREFVGMIVTNVFARDLLEAVSARGAGTSFVINSEGYYLQNTTAPERVFGFEDGIDTVGGVAGANAEQDFSAEEVSALLQTGGASSFETDADSLVYYERISPPAADYYWIVGHIRQADVVFSAANDALQSTLFLTFIFLLVAVVIILWVTQRVTRPLERLSAVAGQLAAGDFDLRATDITRREDEIGQLGRAFNSMAERLQETFSGLERRVQQRTRDLQTSIEVGQLATRLLALDDLLPRVSSFIRQRFDLYYTQIYLLDDAGRYAVLKSGTGEAGQQLLANKHRLDLYETSLVAQSVQNGVAVLVEDTRTSELHKANPLLPDTRSELTIPLIVGEEILGVLDMQANKAGYFNKDNQAVFEAMASQLAAAVRSAQAYEAREEALARAEAITRRQTSDEWLSYLGEVADGAALGYRYDLETPRRLESNDLSGNGKHNGTPGWMLEKSISLHGQVIGQIAVGEEQERSWQPEEVALIDSVADRLAETLDRMRATDATQIALAQAEGLYQLSQSLVGVTRPEEILTVLSERARQQGATQAALSTIGLDELGQPSTVTTIAHWSNDPAIEPGVGSQRDLSQFPGANALLSNPQQPLFINDAWTAPDMDDTERAVAEAMHMSSAVILPLIFAEQWVGLATVVWDETRTFSDVDRQYYAAAAPQVAAILESQRLFVQSEQRASELQTVAEVSAEVTQELDIDKLLNDVALLTRDRFDLYHAHIYLLNDEGDTLELVAGAGAVGDQMVAEGRTIPLAREQSLVAQAARIRAGVIVNDVTADENFLPHPLLPDTQAELAVPMLAGETVIGVLDVQSSNKNRFTEADVRVKSTLAAQIGIAVQNARFFAATDQRARELALVAQVGTEASTVLEINQLLQKVNDMTTDAFGLYHMHIFLADDQHENLTLLAGGGRVPCQHVGKNYTVNIHDESGGLVTQVARTRQGFIVNDTETAAGFAPSNFLPDTRSQMVLPLIAGNELVGVVDIQADRAQAFNDNDLIIQTTLASQIAISIQNAHAYQTTQRLVDELETVSEVSAEVTRNLNLDEMLRDVALLTRDRFDLYHAHIYLLNAEEGRLDLAAGAGDVGAKMLNAKHAISLSHEHSLVARVAREQTSLIANDVTAEPDFLPNPLLPATRAEMAIPMIVGDAVIGVLDVQARQRGRFTDADVRVKSTLAAQIASAVQTARAYSDTQRQQAFLDTVLNASPDLIYVKNRDFIYTLANEGYANVTGRTRDEVVGHDDIEIGFPEEEVFGNPEKGIHGFRKDDSAVLRYGEIIHNPYNPISDKDGHERILDTYKLPLRDPDGEIYGVLAYSRDITEQVEARQQLEQQATILENSDNFIALTTMEGEIVYLNPGGIKMMGFKNLEEAQQTLIPDYHDKAGAKLVLDKGVPTILKQGSWSTENTIISRDGTVIPVDQTLFIVRDAEGNPTNMGTIMVDITDRKAQQEELESQRRLQEAILKTIPSGIFVVRAPDGTPILTNPRAEELLGRGISPDAIQDGLTEIYAAYIAGTNETYPTDQAPVVRGLYGETASIDNMEVERPDGTRILLEVDGAPVMDDAGNIVASLVSFQDITERRAQQEAIQKRAIEMETVAQVSAEATQVLDINKLLNDVALLTRERFELYHAHIYLLNDEGDTLVLTAGAGEVGRMMVAEHRTIPLDREQSLVATAARTGEGVMVNDVQADPNFLSHPLLPYTKAEMAIPMIVGGQMLGVLDVQADEINRFTDEDVRVKTTLAGQVAVAVQNALQYQEVQAAQFNLSERLKELAALQDVGAYGEENLPIDEYMGKVSARLPASMQYPDLAKAALVWNEVVYGDEKAIETPWKLTQPLIIDREHVGDLHIGYTKERDFLPEETPHLSAMANRVSTYLTSRLLSEQIQKRAIEMETVAQVSAEATQTLDIDKLLNDVALLTRDRFELYHAHIYLLNDEGDTLVLTAGAGEVGRMMVAEHRSIPLDREQSLVATAARTGEGVIVNDVAADENFLPLPLLPDTRAEMAIPMIVAGQVLGVLDVQANVTDRFSDEDVRVKTTLAGQVAVAVQNARAFAEARRQTTILEASDDFISLTDLEANVVYLNPGGVRMAGLPEDHDIRGMRIPDFHDEEAFQRISEEAIPQVMAGESWRGENEILRPDGTVVPVDQTIFLIRDAEGNPTNIGTIMIDITERKAQQEALESQTRLQEAILKTIPSGIFVVRAPDGTPILTNPRAEELLGRGISPDAIQDDLTEIYAAYIAGTNETYPTDQAPVVRGLYGETASIDDMEVERPDGTRILLEIDGAPVLDDEGNIVASLVSFQDITERRAQQQAIQKRAIEMETVAQVSAEATTSSDIQELLWSVSNLTKERFDLYHAHIYLLAGQDLTLMAGAGEAGREMVSHGYRIPLEREDSIVARAARSREAVIENNISLSEGFLPNPLLPETQSEMAIPLTFGDQLIGVLDVQSEQLDRFTEEDVRVKTTLAYQIAVAYQNAQAFAQTQKRAAELQTVAQVSATAATELNISRLLDNVVELAKERFELYHAHVYLMDDEDERLVLASGAGDAGRRMVASHHTISVNHPHSLVARAARERVGVTVNDVQANPDFLPNPLLPRTRAELAVPMIVADELIGILDVQADVVGRFTEDDVRIKRTLADQIAVAIQNARLYAEQVETAEQLREVDRLKSEFLASMSHELRTPLNSIIGYAEVILDGIDGPINEDVQEDVDAIYSSGKLLLSLINDILDLAKIEAGQLDLVTEPVEISTFLSSVLDTSRILVKEKPVDLKTKLEDDLPMMDADRLRAQQILNNLISNAAKFTDEGSITVEVKRYGEDMVRFAVVDTGSGISEDKLETIFERFRQADQSSTRRAGGTGLGLAITRQLVEMHSGEIHVESVLNEGSTFWFTMPVAAETEDEV